MAFCLNTNSALILYRDLVNSEYFVDKSAIIEHISKRIRTSTKYVCVTKPRRFGNCLKGWKSVKIRRLRCI